MMKVIEYDPKYRQDFIDFNTEWIVGNFGFLEKEDLETFETIEQSLKDGAMIYFAIDEDTQEAMATCMTKPMDGTCWELCKMGANEKYKGRGAGNAVFEAAIQYAIDHGAKRLFMLSNSSLKPAMHMYETHGFQEIKLDNYEYERGDIAFEYIV
ncbi:MAG: GNAT family N-acetyltransferase [Clostridia bacterium]|nr:GNAT family N-acetyltransferase [Clostridia bacterium]